MSPVHEKIRPPAVAGRFYDDDASRCAADSQLLCHAPKDITTRLSPTAILYGALVPHAGWMCSGRVAGMTWATLAGHTRARTVVLTGSIHTMAVFGPTLESADKWATPIGDVAVNHDLRAALAALPDFNSLDMAHEREHSLEVQVPLMLTAFGEGVRFVPCLIPPHEQAVRWGQRIGEVLADWPEPVVMVVSSDLTHYGPNYRFTPEGVGEAGVQWAFDVNDRRLLDRVESLNAEAIVDETRRRLNACGGGAIAATLACCRTLGATGAVTLAHTNSSRELAPIGHADPANSVGYAGVVFE